MVHVVGPQGSILLVGSYLRLRGGTYHFRVRIPGPLRKAVGKGEMTVSLGTGRFDSAVRAARTIRTGLDSIMEANDQGASYVDIERRVRSWMGRSALDYEARIALNDGLGGAFSADEAQTMGSDTVSGEWTRHGTDSVWVAMGVA